MMPIPSISTKFFTNQDENTLLDKIKGIFMHRNIYFFDALVGYFYASGYFRVRPYIERSAEVRVLVGINVNKLVQQASQQGVPNEKKALAFLDAFQTLPVISDEEKILIGQAKEAIWRGRFQNLQCGINKLQKTQKTIKVQAGPRSAAVLLDSLVKILNGYPLGQVSDDGAATPVVPVPVAPTEPAIIISESFSA